jgi:hypothetical protein
MRRAVREGEENADVAEESEERREEEEALNAEDAEERGEEGDWGEDEEEWAEGEGEENAEGAEVSEERRGETEFKEEEELEVGLELEVVEVEGLVVMSGSVGSCVPQTLASGVRNALSVASPLPGSGSLLFRWKSDCETMRMTS